MRMQARTVPLDMAICSYPAMPYPNAEAVARHRSRYRAVAEIIPLAPECGDLTADQPIPPGPEPAGPATESKPRRVMEPAHHWHGKAGTIRSSGTWPRRQNGLVTS